LSIRNEIQSFHFDRFKMNWLWGLFDGRFLDIHFLLSFFIDYCRRLILRCFFIHFDLFAVFFINILIWAIKIFFLLKIFPLLPLIIIVELHFGKQSTVGFLFLQLILSSKLCNQLQLIFSLNISYIYF